MSGYMIFILVAVVGLLVQLRLRSKFKKYSKMPLSCGLSGAEIAQKMLEENGIHNVSITCVAGTLTDHYNPSTKTVNLSQDVFHGRSIAAAAVAAHECGHAVQDVKLYSWLQLRSSLVPVVSVASNLLQWVLIAGILMIKVMPWLLLLGIIMFAVVTLFSFITLPVEFDASKRALMWLKNTNITGSGEEFEGAKDALSWAASTYVVAAIGSLAMLLYYIGIFRD